MPIMNPLAAQVPAPAATPQPAHTKHPQQDHANIWKQAHSLPAEALPHAAERMDYAVPIFGRLAADPNVTSKDVIKAASNAAADGMVKPSEAVAIISNMPADEEHLRPWLKQQYLLHLSGAVHVKAALMNNNLPVPGLPSAPAQPQPSAAPAAQPAQPMPSAAPAPMPQQSEAEPQPEPVMPR